jgi:NTE family protein
MAKTLGIAFGGSGAEGIACLAYIKVLEEAGIKPVIVSGTGIGGVAAAMFASGMTFQDMMDFIEEIEFPGAKRPINVTKIKDAKIGILDDMGLEEYFKMVVPIKVFDRLYFPLKIVAADYQTGEEIILSEGDVGQAVRAGVSVPGIFSPYQKDGITYLDGSSVNPVPFDIIRNDCEVLVSIEPDTQETEGENVKDFSVFPAMMGSYINAKRALSREKQKNCKVDIYEHVVLEGITTFDFALYENIISSVSENAEKFIEELAGIL